MLSRKCDKYHNLMRLSGYVIINSRRQCRLMRKLGMIVRVISLPADDSHEIT